MSNLESAFAFNLTDLQMNYRQEVTSKQKQRLQATFREDLKLTGFNIVGGWGILFVLTSVANILYESTWRTQWPLLIVYASTLAVQWSSLVGKHSLARLYKRISTVSGESSVHVLTNIQQSAFVQDRPKLPPHANQMWDQYGYYTHWIKSYTWYNSQSYEWYRFTGSSFVLYLPEPQYNSLLPNLRYTFYCFVDLFGNAYVLSVEAQDKSHHTEERTR